ncbi:hypothetical protein HK101_003084 [Irineochytrium annulatum]|nr:hypothetical protein HK101_003084 [Irineochytrium annulatum]
MVDAILRLEAENKELKKMEAEMDSLTSDCANFRNKCIAMSSEVESSRMGMSELEVEVESLKEQLKLAKNESKQLGKENADLRDRLEREAKGTERFREEWVSKERNLFDQLKALRQENRSAKALNLELEKRLSDASAVSSASNCDLVAELREKLKDCERRIIDMTVEQAKSNQTIQGLESLLQTERDDTLRLHQKCDELESLNATLMEDAESYQILLEQRVSSPSMAEKLDPHSLHDLLAADAPPSRLLHRRGSSGSDESDESDGSAPTRYNDDDDDSRESNSPMCGPASRSRKGSLSIAEEFMLAHPVSSLASELGGAVAHDAAEIGRMQDEIKALNMFISKLLAKVASSHPDDEMQPHMTKKVAAMPTTVRRRRWYHVLSSAAPAKPAPAPTPAPVVFDMIEMPQVSPPSSIPPSPRMVPQHLPAATAIADDMPAVPAPAAGFFSSFRRISGGWRAPATAAPSAEPAEGSSHRASTTSVTGCEEVVGTGDEVEVKEIEMEAVEAEVEVEAVGIETETVVAKEVAVKPVELLDEEAERKRMRRLSNRSCVIVASVLQDGAHTL